MVVVFEGQVILFLCFTGKLTALSVNNRIDCDDCVLFTPEGVLVLSLLRDTYLRLGVEGKVSRYHGKTKARYGK